MNLADLALNLLDLVNVKRQTQHADCVTNMVDVSMGVQFMQALTVGVDNGSINSGLAAVVGPFTLGHGLIERVENARKFFNWRHGTDLYS